jgi:hypothetical protein
MRHPAITTAIAAAITVALAQFGASQALGAHPFWAAQIGWIGAGVGLVLAGLVLVLGWPRRKLAALAALLTVAAYAAAYFGKAEFAASYAENQLAGQFWYFGWIAAATGQTLTLALALARPIRG